ncbi:MAG TPA: CopG family transcriptional regulator [Methanophagales archaeon]|nr:CopG family transcriptional regulator [Methanophagales archaeon]
MKPPEGVTVALDEETFEVFKKMKDELRVSQSELMREALKFYSKYRTLFEPVDAEKVRTYIEMLSTGEHIIMDIDHWLLFLNFIESHPDNEKFWESHKAICEAHAEQFKYKLYHDAEYVLKRLEACNLFKLSENSENAFTLVLGPDVTRKFIKTELEEIFGGMGFKVNIKEDLAKLRVRVLHDLNR